VTTTYGYDSAGRVTSASQPEPGGGTLTTGYAYPSGVQTTVTLPTNATQVTTLYLDGKVKERGGSAQVDMQFVYALELGGTGNIVATTQNGSSTANGWTEIKTDWLGRTMTQRTPEVTWTSGSTKTICKTYSYSGTTGQLLSYTTVDQSTSAAVMAPHLYNYGTLGQLIQEGDDVDASGALIASLTDRITNYNTTYSKETTGYLGWIREDTVEVLRTLNNSSNFATVSDQRIRLTQFNGGAMLGSARVLSDVVTINPSGRSSETLVSANVTAHTRSQTVSVQGVSNSTLMVWQDGYLKSDQSISGVTKTYAYNSQGLPSSVIEGTTNAATSYNYFSNTSYPSSTVVTIGASATATTTYAYTWNTSTQSTMVALTDAAGNIAYTESNALGLPWHSWGTSAQPTLTSYDSYGRKTALTTWQTGSFTGTTWPNPSGGNAITWNLDAATGAVTSKVYPNSSSVGFTYNARGQVKTRTWARGTITTYTYVETSGSSVGELGDLQSIGYSDSTPGVSYTYTRFGTPATVIDATGTTARTLNWLFADFNGSQSELKLKPENDLWWD